jgi:hypothetical protein
VDIKNAKIGVKTTKLQPKEGAGTNYEGLKRNWAKMKEKGLNRKESPKVEGYFCEYRKTQGLFCKNT